MILRDKMIKSARYLDIIVGHFLRHLLQIPISKLSLETPGVFTGGSTVHFIFCSYQHEYNRTLKWLS